MKRLFSLFLALLLLLGCFAFSVSAETPAPAVSERNIRFSVNKDLIFTLDAGDSKYWSDFAKKRQDDDENYILIDSQGVVMLYAKGYGTYYVYDVNWVLQQDFYIIESTYYLVKVHSYFSVEEYIVGSGPSGVVHELGQILYYTLPDLVEEGVYFNHDVLGLCRFEYFSEAYKNIVLFRVGIKSDGSYTKQYYLISKDDMTVLQGDDIVGSCPYYVVDPCDVGVHAFSNWVTIDEPTCIDKGSATRFCMICYEREHTEVSPLGHTYGEWLEACTCTRCGHFDLLQRPGSGNTDGSSGGGADNSGGDSDTDGGAGGGGGDDAEGNSEGHWYDGIVNWWNGLWTKDDPDVDAEGSSGDSWIESYFDFIFNSKRTGDWLWDGGTVLLRLLAAAVLVVPLFFLFPLLKPLFGLLLDLIKALIGAISSGAKKLGKWAKSKSKKAKKKKTNKDK